MEVRVSKTNSELIAECGRLEEENNQLKEEVDRLKRFYNLLTRAIIHHYTERYGEMDKDKGEQLSVVSDE